MHFPETERINKIQRKKAGSQTKKTAQGKPVILIGSIQPFITELIIISC